MSDELGVGVVEIKTKGPNVGPVSVPVEPPVPATERDLEIAEKNLERSAREVEVCEIALAKKVEQEQKARERLAKRKSESDALIKNGHTRGAERLVAKEIVQERELVHITAEVRALEVEVSKAKAAHAVANAAVGEVWTSLQIARGGAAADAFISTLSERFKTEVLPALQEAGVVLGSFLADFARHGRAGQKAGRPLIALGTFLESEMGRHIQETLTETNRRANCVTIRPATGGYAIPPVVIEPVISRERIAELAADAISPLELGDVITQPILPRQ